MEVDAQSSSTISLATSNDFPSEAHQPQRSHRRVWAFVQQKILQPLTRIHTYLVWCVLIILCILPLIWSCLRPLWRIVSWIAPTILAIEVDAGNRTSIYVTKAVLWVLQTGLTQYMLVVTDGFRKKANLQHVGLTLSILLFLASCIITIIGMRLKGTLIFREEAVTIENNLRFTDRTRYASLHQRWIKTPLTLNDLEGAWTVAHDIESGRRKLTTTEISNRVIYTSFMTQFVLARVVKDSHNHVFVYCPVAQYRTLLLVCALGLAGIVHIFQDLFEGAKERDVVTSMILWLTLPSITLPALVRIKFGSHAALGHLRRGLLPVENDVHMWERLGVSAQDLYTALTNAFGAEKVFADYIEPVGDHGRGTVKIQDIEEAKKLCIKSLLTVGDTIRIFVRISDGRRWILGNPYELQSLPTDKDRVEYNHDETLRSPILSIAEFEERRRPEVVQDSQDEDQREAAFSLAPGTRILSVS